MLRFLLCIIITYFCFRVFCSSEHEKQFKENKEELVQRQNDAATSDTDSDGSADEGDDDDEEEEKVTNEIDSNASDSDFNESIDMNQTDLLMTTLHDTPAKNTNAECDLEIRQNSQDWKPEIVSVETLYNNENCVPSKTIVVKKPDAQSRSEPLVIIYNKPTKQQGKSIPEKVGAENGLLREDVKETQKDLKILKRLRESDSDDHGRNKKTPRSQENETYYPDCHVVIPNSLGCKERTRKDLEGQLGETTRVVFWPTPREGLNLSNEHMPLLINDIVNYLSKNDVSDMKKILMDSVFLESRLHDHNYALSLHKQLDMATALTASLMKSIADTVSKINNKGICQLLTANDGTIAVAVFIDKKLDPSNKLRSALGIEEISSRLHMLSDRLPHIGTPTVQQQEKESSDLKHWIDNSYKTCLKVECYPKETFLLDTSRIQSVAHKVAQRCTEDASSPQLTNHDESPVICISRMDTCIINYKQFCHKCIASFQPFTKPAMFIVDIVNDVFTNVDDLVPEEIRRNYNVKVYSSGKPSQVSSVLLHVLTGQSVQRESNGNLDVSDKNATEPKSLRKEETPKKRIRVDGPSNDYSPVASCSYSYIDRRKNKRST
ncbi:uncharacterized protein [Argopecten irradians]|uniref:uncharacterized protein isoform X2 n=1 Tax=Argopecten irradians TaxID=31199 RepID=UPI00371A1F18